MSAAGLLVVGGSGDDLGEHGSHDARGAGRRGPVRNFFWQSDGIRASRSSMGQDMACWPSWITSAQARCGWPAPQRGAGWHSTPPRLPPARSRAWGWWAPRGAGPGPPEPELAAATGRLEPLLDKAYAARDAGEINRLETWLWLDGPGQPEGRVGGAARKLALDMNAIIIGNGVPETAGATGVDA